VLEQSLDVPLAETSLSKILSVIVICTPLSTLVRSRKSSNSDNGIPLSIRSNRTEM
jgi:hypothetical protein